MTMDRKAWLAGLAGLMWVVSGCSSSTDGTGNGGGDGGNGSATNGSGDGDNGGNGGDGGGSTGDVPQGGECTSDDDCAGDGCCAGDGTCGELDPLFGVLCLSEGLGQATECGDVTCSEIQCCFDEENSICGTPGILGGGCQGPVECGSQSCTGFGACCADEDEGLCGFSIGGSECQGPEVCGETTCGQLECCFDADTDTCGRVDFQGGGGCLAPEPCGDTACTTCCLDESNGTCAESLQDCVMMSQDAGTDAGDEDAGEQDGGSDGGTDAGDQDAGSACDPECTGEGACCIESTGECGVEDPDNAGECVKPVTCGTATCELTECCFDAEANECGVPSETTEECLHPAEACGSGDGCVAGQCCLDATGEGICGVPDPDNDNVCGIACGDEVCAASGCCLDPERSLCGTPDGQACAIDCGGSACAGADACCTGTNACGTWDGTMCQEPTQ